MAIVSTNARGGVRKLNGNASVADVLSGKTFYSTDPKNVQTGSMPDQGAWTKSVTPSSGQQTIIIPAGHHNGSGKVIVNGVSNRAVTKYSHNCTLNPEDSWNTGWIYSEKFVVPVTPVSFNYRTKGHNANGSSRTVNYCLQGATNAACTSWITIHTIGNRTTNANSDEDYSVTNAAYNGGTGFFQFRIATLDPNRADRRNSYIQFNTYKILVTL